MTTFFCDECKQPFEVDDEETVQAMIHEHLETGDCFTCLECQPNTEETLS